MAIDSHMHINSFVLDSKEKDKALSSLRKDINLEKVINVGLNYSTTNEAIELCRKTRKMYVSAGVHPLYIRNQNLNKLFAIANNEFVVAIGETGLDNMKENYKEQRRFLIAQILIANDLHLPVIIHSNNCNFQVVEIFKTIVKPKYGCVFHCFQPDEITLNYLIANGYYISFAGPITYKTEKRSLEMAKLVPEKLFLVETDAPYLTPEPFRNDRNNSSNIMYIIEKLAEVRNTTYHHIVEVTKENTLRLFPKLK